jgi:hypothetical protein
MTTKFTTLAKTAAFAIAAMGFSGAAYAECSSGLLADLACQAGLIDQDTAQGLDRLNGAMGQPVDNAIYTGMDAVVPGSGAAAAGYAQLQRQMSRTGRGAPSAPSSYGQPYQPQTGYGQPVPYQQSAYTMTCYTPAGPIMVNNPMVVGSQCYAMTPMGTFYGQAGY